METFLGSNFTDKNQQKIMFDTKIKYVKVLATVLVSLYRIVSHKKLISSFKSLVLGRQWKLNGCLGVIIC